MDKRPDRPNISETLRYAMFGAIFGATFPLVGTLARLLLLQLPINITNMIYAQSADPLLWVVDTAPLVLGIFAAYAGYKQDLIHRINEELYQREAELRTNETSLEKRLADRTTELQLANQYNERRAKQFESIAQVSRAINQTQGLQDLLPQITQVINQQFSFYHVGIFLLDANNEYAVFSASNSEGGQRMLARNHKLKVGQEGIVGIVAKNKIPRVALDIGADAIYFNNPDLPETRSEMALPLIQTGGQIIGVLDIQSAEANAFSSEDINILLTLANQVATAIVNARFYEETQKALIESEMFYRSSIRTGWKKFTRAQQIAGIRRFGMNASLYEESMDLPGTTEVMTSGTAYLQNMQMTIPVKLRGEVVGILNVKTDENRKWTDDEVDIITAIVERTALSIENARLLEESRTAAEKERTIGEFSAKIGSLNTLDSLIQTALQELGSVLPNTDIAIQLSTEKPGRA